MTAVTPSSAAATRGMVDEKVLNKMKQSAVLVNVGRGPLVVTDDLVAALDNGVIAGAALDVTDPEPLPQDHPLWTAPGVLITPHVGGVSTAFRPRAVRMLREQLGRLLGALQADGHQHLLGGDVKAGLEAALEVVGAEVHCTGQLGQGNGAGETGLHIVDGAAQRVGRFARGRQGPGMGAQGLAHP